jgi:tetratricopeptide (TPR) repeat protein
MNIARTLFCFTYRQGCVVLLTGLVIFWANVGRCSGDIDSPEKTYNLAKTQLAADPAAPDALWEFGRACFVWAEASTSDSQREKIANEGIAASKKLLQEDEHSVPGHYYLGLNLGQLVRTKRWGVTKIYRQMETEFMAVLTLDAKYDHAGADRNLGLLYLDAPGWPFGVGDESKGRQYLAKAVELATDYPENQLDLIEAELKMGDKTDASRRLNALAMSWPRAQKDFPPRQWSDWEKRRVALENQIARKSRKGWAGMIPAWLQNDFQALEINGHPASMVMLTTVPVTGLLESKAKRLGLKSSGDWADEYGVSIRTSDPVRVTSGGQTLDVPLPMGRLPWWARIGIHFVTIPVDGVVGWPEIRDNILFFDSRQHLIRRLEQLPLESSGWVKLKVVPEDRLLLELPLPNGSLSIISIDTGERGPTAIAMSGGLWKQWAATNSYAGWANEIKLGALTLTDVTVKALPAGEARSLLYDMPIAKAAWKFGMAAFTRMDLIVDARDGWAYVHPLPPLSATNVPVGPGDWKVAKNVQLSSDNLFVYSGDYKWAKNDFTGAEIDFRHAVELNPRNATAYSALGSVRQVLGDFSGAVSNYDKVIQLRPDTSEWERLYRQSILWRLNPSTPEIAGPIVSNEPTHSAVVLDTVVVRAVRPKGSARKTDRWPKTLSLFLDGDIDEKALLLAAKTSDGETPAPEQEGLACYYIGVKRLSKGDKAGAREYFQKCRSAGIKDDAEYQYSVAELARLR